jgi:transcriptional regulator with XRE-family HTH domain
MKFGDVLRKEREKAKLSASDMASKMRIPQAEYEKMEAGESAAERWAPKLALIAIKLEYPTSRFVSESGKSADAKPGQLGTRVRARREERKMTAADLAKAIELSGQEYDDVEEGKSPLEHLAPLFLSFAEAIDQPVFNLFYPCGLAYSRLKDYP